MDENEIVELRKALERDCGLVPAAGTPANRESLVDELARRVDYLLRHDAEKLMFYLYTLDVSEDVVPRAFETQEPARFIAAAMLDREAERLRTRRRYERKTGSGDVPLPP